MGIIFIFLTFIIGLIYINRYKKYKDTINFTSIKRRMVITIVVVSIIIVGSSILGHFIIPTIPTHNNTSSGILLSMGDLAEKGITIMIVMLIVIFIIGRLLSYFHNKEQSQKNDNEFQK